MRRAVILWGWAALAWCQGVPAPRVEAAAASWLQLEEVLASVDRHYPPLLVAMQDKVIADADITVAESRFDVALKGGYEGDYLGYYRNDYYKAGVEQATQFQGMSYFTGYTLGRGSYPTYEGKRQTDGGGEYKAGVRMPALRDRAIDSRRAELQKATLGRRIADLGVDQQRTYRSRFLRGIVEDSRLLAELVARRAQRLPAPRRELPAEVVSTENSATLVN